MIVRCPHCATESLLPEDLLGESGARVRCPACERRFDVHRDPLGAAALDAVAPDPAAPSLESGAGGGPAEDMPPADPAEVAAMLLDGLATRLGPAWTEARARGRLLSQFGPEVLRVYGEYRSRLGDHATAEAFRSVLRERWDLDLAPEPEERTQD